MTQLEMAVKRRVKEFEELGKKGAVIFNFSPFLNLKFKATIQTELAFCISTANSSAISGLRFQKSLENRNIEDIPLRELEELLKTAGVRFHKRKALYIKEAVNNFEAIEEVLEYDNARDRLVKNVKGLGYKEASHFLRNVGEKNVAILDRHILKYLLEYRYLDEIPNLNAEGYRNVEDILRKIAKGMSLAELDLLLWYHKTRKILK